MKWIYGSVKTRSIIINENICAQNSIQKCYKIASDIVIYYNKRISYTINKFVRK